MKEELTFIDQVKRLVQHSENVQIISIDDMMQGAVPCNLFEEVLREFVEERERLGYDPHQRERDKTWSILNNQIVGAEVSLDKPVPYEVAIGSR